MRTKLPARLDNIDEAKEFVRELHKNYETAVITRPSIWSMVKQTGLVVDEYLTLLDRERQTKWDNVIDNMNFFNVAVILDTW